MALRYLVKDGKLYRDDRGLYDRWRNRSTGLVFLRTINKPNGTYRYRRKKLVRIPDKWVGKTLHKRTHRKRNTVSRRTRKKKKE